MPFTIAINFKMLKNKSNKRYARPFGEKSQNTTDGHKRVSE